MQSPEPSYPGMVLPATSLLRRLEAQLEATRESRDELPWWQRRNRHVLTGAIAAYMVEIEDLKVLMAKFASGTDIMA
jgi:hypothetical protein